jgi:hypothetical protein
MMKTFLPLKKISDLWLPVVVLFITNIAFSQGTPQLQFTNAVLESGTAGADGATYRFSNVTPGVDAVVLIKGRSSNDVVLSSIDTAGPGLGYDQAFQPVLGIPGVAPANSVWSMDFQLNFYKTGTTKKVKISQFDATGLDIDGDGLTLSEWTQMNGIQSIDSALINSLTFTKMSHGGHGDDYKVEGIITNSPGIDTTAKNVMATYKFMNLDEISFTIGAKTSVLPTSAGMRLNSIWFRDFLGVLLPVKLVSFTAVLNNTTTDLQWKTASEINVSRFVIEKSTDGKNFKDAGIVQANGNSTQEISYSFKDIISEKTNVLIYYRLRSIDIDGKYEYSAVKIIRAHAQDERDSKLLGYPNPATNEFHITLPSDWQSKNVAYALFDAKGQLVNKRQTGLSGQTETFNLTTLAPGIYMVIITCEGQTKQQKFIKA